MEKNIALACASLSIYVAKKIVDKRLRVLSNRRKTWQVKWLKRRDADRGMLNMLREELLLEDPNHYNNFLRMDNELFSKLLSMILPDIEERDTHLRQCISAENRLAVTLRYLASGNSFKDLMFATRIHESTISLIVPEVCEAIICKLMPEYIKLPSNAEEWKKVSDEFIYRWNFPLCSGALDEKHIDFEAPKSAGSFYYNYNGQNRIVLLGLTDAHYKFLYVDMGVNGRASDGGVFRESSLKKGMDRNILTFPEDSYLPNNTIKMPYVFVADDAFPLSNRLIKPHPQQGLSNDRRIFNYRLSRARRVVENAFGILVNRFRILRGKINLDASKAETIALACCVLHNFLATHSRWYTEMDNEQCNLGGVSQQGGSRHTSEAINMGNQLCSYFNTIGKVSWQNRCIGIE